MALSAIWILVFHFWIVESSFIKSIGYIGVDIFFFLSGYSLADKPTWGRAKVLYIRFALASVVAFFYKGWSLGYLAKVLIGVDLLERGGGAFLWFVPAMIIFYLAYPLFKTGSNRSRIAMAVIWVIFALVVVNRYHQLGIVWLRIPVFLLGYYFSKVTLKDSTRYVIGIVLVLVGTLLAYKFGYRYKLQAPIYNMFYLCAIPLILGVVLLLQKVREYKLVTLVGSATFEIYAIQMIFGYDLMSSLLSITDNILIVNMVTLVVIIFVSILVNQFGRKLKSWTN